VILVAVIVAAWLALAGWFLSLFRPGPRTARPLPDRIGDYQLEPEWATVCRSQIRALPEAPVRRAA
jgi:hypothetical protein